MGMRGVLQVLLPAACVATLRQSREADVQAASRVTGTEGLWPAGEEIPWLINVTDAYEGQSPLKQGDSRVLFAIQHFEERTCLRFRQCASEAECLALPRYIEFWAGSACSSPVGAQRGRNRISLKSNCGHDSAVHEVGHSMGLDHEQKRRDRDDFIVVHEDNIQDKWKSQFTKLYSGRELGAYDYRGIMHYPRWGFQKEYGKPALSAPLPLIGETGGLSKGDVEALDFMYNGCSKEYTAPTCMTSIDNTKTHVIPHSKPFLASFASQYRVGGVVTVSYGVTTAPADEIENQYGSGVKFFNGGAQTSILFNPTSRDAGKSFVLGVNFGGDGGEDTVCFLQVRVARSDNVCFQKEGSDPFVCSGRGVCTDKVLEPCRCDVGTGGPECEGDATCPRNVADNFDSGLGDWANGYTTWPDSTKRVGDTGASLRMGQEPFSGGNRAELPLWSLTKPSRVSYDMAVRNMSDGFLSGGMWFGQAPFQKSSTQCMQLFVDSPPVPKGQPRVGPYVWEATSGWGSGVELNTSWAIQDERFFHFDIAFDWRAMLAVVSIDGKEEFRVPIDAGCADGFDQVTASGNAWLDNFDLHCTSFVPPEHPGTSAPPATEKPTPFPTPQPTEPPAACRDFVELSGPSGMVDYPEGDAGYFFTSLCRRIVCGGPLTLTFTLLDTSMGDNVTVLSYDANGEEQMVAQYWGTELPAPATYYTGDMIVRFNSMGGWFEGGKGFTFEYTCAGTPSPTATQAPPTAVPTPAPPTQVPTAIPATAVPTVAPPTPLPETVVPRTQSPPRPDFPKFCYDGEELEKPTGTVAHPGSPTPRDPNAVHDADIPVLPTYKNGESKCWRIKCDKQLVLTWTLFDMEADKDFVSLWLERPREESQLVWKKSGQVLPLEAGYTGDVLIHFETDKEGVATGISVNWVCADVTPAPATPVPVPTFAFPDFCEGSGVLLQTPGFVQYPGRGELTYAPNERVCWHLQCSGTVHIQWTKFHTEWGYDHMHVFQLEPSLQQVAKRSGHFLPTLFREEVQGDALVHFRSDFNIQSLGVEFEWQCL